MSSRCQNVNTLLDAFKIAQWNLLKLKKYKGLVSEDDSIHSIHTVNQISDISKSSGHSLKQRISIRPYSQFRMENPTHPALNTLIINIKTVINEQHHILELATHVEYLVTCDTTVSISSTGLLPLSLNTPSNISSHRSTPNKPLVLMQQLTADYVLNQNAWKEIAAKLNEMANENGLIKQGFHKTYNTVAGMLGMAKSKTPVTNPDDRINNKKQINPGKKC